VAAFGGGNRSGAIEAAACLTARGHKCDFEVETFITQPLPFDTTQITSAANYSNPQPGDPCHPLARGAHAPAVAFSVSQNANGFAWEGAVSATLQSRAQSPSGNQFDGIRHGSAIRRLTPRECERLQGFPDDYTLVPYRKRLAADGPRYQALGNSMATNVMAWIGKRIAAQEADLRATIPMLEAAE